MGPVIWLWFEGVFMHVASDVSVTWPGYTNTNVHVQLFPAADGRHRVETEVWADEGAGDPAKATSNCGGAVDGRA